MNSGHSPRRGEPNKAGNDGARHSSAHDAMGGLPGRQRQDRTHADRWLLQKLAVCAVPPIWAAAGMPGYLIVEVQIMCSGPELAQPPCQSGEAAGRDEISQPDQPVPPLRLSCPWPPPSRVTSDVTLPPLSPGCELGAQPGPRQYRVTFLARGGLHLWGGYDQCSLRVRFRGFAGQGRTSLTHSLPGLCVFNAREEAQRLVSGWLSLRPSPAQRA